VQEVLEDFQNARLGEPEKVLFAFLDRVNQESSRLTAEDVAAVVAAGWSEEAVYDAITVCALFNFYNRWIDATGVHALSDEAHRLGGKRSAVHGYVRE
jgi:alkylhydroperoxidase family enzyme